MHNIIRETTETTTTLTTLAQLMEQRRVQRAEEEREEQEKADREREQRIQEKIDRFTEMFCQRVTLELIEVLGIHVIHDPDFYDDCAAVWEIDGARWSVSRSYRAYDDPDWTLSGPSDYRVMLPDYSREHRDFTPKILDAVDAYPAWLEALLETQPAIRQQTVEAATEIVTALPIKRTIPHYAQPESMTTRGLLHPDAHITIWMVPATSDEREQQTNYTGRLTSWNDRWILLTCDGPSQQQRLIPIARVDEIIPEAEPEETKQETEDISAVFAAEAAAVRLREERAGANEAAEYQSPVRDDIPF